MKLTVLGNSGGYPAANRACSGYLAHEGEKALLLDCGSGVLSRLFALMDPCDLEGIVITHWHFDHGSDLLPLQYYLQARKKTLPIYAPTENAPLRKLCDCPEFSLHSLEEADQAGLFSLSAIRTKHTMPSFAVKVGMSGRTLVYTGDAAEGQSLEAFCRDADVLLCDAAFSKTIWHEGLPHMSAEMAAKLAETTAHAKLLLTHFPPAQDVATLLREACDIYPNTQAAQPGMQIDI